MSEIETIEQAYLTLLRLPLAGSFRFRLQGTLAALRDIIAEAHDKTAYAVHTEFEDRARNIKNI